MKTLKPWITSVLTSGLLSFLGTFAFARANDTSLEHSFFLGIGVMCVMITLHRMIALMAHDLNPR